MEHVGHEFIPAAGRDWALPFYDPLVKLIGGDRTRALLADLAAPQAGQVVLDLGCGTGTLVTQLKRRHPDVDVVGVDPDPAALARARRKLARAGLQARLDQAFANALPYPGAAFDRVLCSFVYHHLEPAQKEAALREVRRVLKPGGLFALLDFAGPEAAAEGRAAGWLHASHRLADNDAGLVVGALRQAGFEEARRVARGSLALGLATYSCFLGVAPR